MNHNHGSPEGVICALGDISELKDVWIMTIHPSVRKCHQVHIDAIPYLNYQLYLQSSYDSETDMGFLP